MLGVVEKCRGCLCGRPTDRKAGLREMDYRTVYECGKGEIVEKKSRFIGEVFPVETEEEAAENLRALSRSIEKTGYQIAVGRGDSRI